MSYHIVRDSDGAIWPQVEGPVSLAAERKAFEDWDAGLITSEQARDRMEENARKNKAIIEAS